MKTSYRNTIFFSVMVFYLATPLYMIGRYEWVLQQGDVFKFHLQPIDPYDAFRGKYVALRFAGDTVSLSDKDTNFKDGDEVFASVVKDAKGFGEIKEISKSIPDDGNYFKTSIYSVDLERTESGQILRNFARIEFPFDKFYMNENLASEAEDAYRNASRDTDSNSYTEVAIKNGNGIVKELYIKDTPIVQFLKQRAK